MGRDIRLSEDRIEGYRHFVNKLWNAARFTLMNLAGENPKPVDLGSVEGLHHKWILHRLEEVKGEVSSALANYRFNDAAQACYKFLWGAFCDWYLELVKPDMQSEDASRKQAAQYVLVTVLREILVLLHPIMPFVTAEIWAALPGSRDLPELACMRYPESRPQCQADDDARNMEFLQEVIVSVRTIKAELNISPGKKVHLLLQPVDEAQKALLLTNAEVICQVARLEDMRVDLDLQAPRASASAVACGCQIVVPLRGTVDLAGELTRLDKQLAKLEKNLLNVNRHLQDENFLSRASEEVVAREKTLSSDLLDKKEKLLAMRARFAEALAEEA